MRRTASIAVLVVAAACSKKQDAVTGSSSAKLPATHAAAVGEFQDNRLLAYVPADTPYAFASFKPIPPEYIDRMASLFEPLVTRARDVPGPGTD
jgi:hypothetical protein